ncbi:nucleoside phosphorylase [Lachnospiraceae bacterium MD329]|nr:nucleoside phosphorylase [Lachnospiraceae bacterium MD329]
MIIKNKYPVCEHDTSRNPIINPADFLTKTLPEKCVITFFSKELNQLVGDKQLHIIEYLHSEVLDIPIYEYDTPSGKICITMAFCGAPGAAVTLEELHAMGCNKFIICGGAGSIKKDSEVGEIIVPVAAVRDEGTSYHYLEPSREVECHKETVETVVSCLKQMSIPFTTGKTWTSDAIYRETPDMVELRRNEGCITVEMEAAAFFAVSKYHNIPLAQLLYAGDDVSGEKWDSRDWNNQKSVRSNLILTAIKLIEEL